MPESTVRGNPNVATPDELRSLLSARLAALEAATMQKGQEAPLPIEERWGWKSTIKTLGRDAGGHLRATVTVSQPGGSVVYVRKVRLVPERRLPSSLTRQLRES